jgi:hypothetical protein
MYTEEAKMSDISYETLNKGMICCILNHRLSMSFTWLENKREEVIPLDDKT